MHLRRLTRAVSALTHSSFIIWLEAKKLALTNKDSILFNDHLLMRLTKPLVATGSFVFGRPNTGIDTQHRVQGP
jgi:hypothetical protein